MTSLIRAELRKLVTTRTVPALAAGSLVLIIAGIFATAATTTPGGSGSAARAVLAVAGLAQTFALLAGVLSVTSEYRHKTIISALLTTPRRLPVLVAKLITLAITGLVAGVLATGVATAITLPVLAGKHIPAGVGGVQVAAIIAGGGVATALCAALGVAVGAIVRNQVGAVITVLALLYIVVPMFGFIPGVGPAVQEYGIDGLAAAATATTAYPIASHLLGQVTAGAVLAGYAAAALLAGAAVFYRRDIAD
ncbi:MAG TPA: ABC transporter permease subunit [Streptosporangiaceae bacterium]|jgi:ABC-2 type transport system permease protein